MKQSHPQQRCRKNWRRVIFWCLAAGVQIGTSQTPAMGYILAVGADPAAPSCVADLTISVTAQFNTACWYLDRIEFAQQADLLLVTIYGVERNEGCAQWSPPFTWTRAVLPLEAGEYTIRAQEILTPVLPNGFPPPETREIALSVAATSAADTDGDGFSGCQDCDGDNAAAWSTPGEPTGLDMRGDRMTLDWSSPAAPGGTDIRYDTLRSSVAGDFLNNVVCLESGDGSDTSAMDPSFPGFQRAFYYLVRARTACQGSLSSGNVGTDSAGSLRLGRTCP